MGRGEQLRRPAVKARDELRDLGVDDAGAADEVVDLAPRGVIDLVPGPRILAGNVSTGPVRQQQAREGRCAIGHLGSHVSDESHVVSLESDDEIDVIKVVTGQRLLRWPGALTPTESSAARVRRLDGSPGIAQVPAESMSHPGRSRRAREAAITERVALPVQTKSRRGVGTPRPITCPHDR